jgi:hypothetical protein
MFTILKESYPVARKEHRCMFCGHIIKPGEKYRRTTIAYDGEVYDWIEDLNCTEVFDIVRERLDVSGYLDYDEGLTPESFQTEVWEILSEDLELPYNEIEPLSVHEQVLKVLEHKDEIRNNLAEAKRADIEYRKKLQYFRNKDIEAKSGQLTHDEICAYKQEYATWLRERSFK